MTTGSKLRNNTESANEASPRLREQASPSIESALLSHMTRAVDKRSGQLCQAVIRERQSRGSADESIADLEAALRKETHKLREKINVRIKKNMDVIEFMPSQETVHADSKAGDEVNSQHGPKPR